MDRCASEIVLKDQSGCLSENVFICANRNDVEMAFNTMTHSGVERILGEQRLIGKEYSVESLSINGTHTVLGVTEKYPYEDKLFERCQVFPATRLPAQTQEEITGYIERLLNKIGHHHGPTHIEIMVSDNDLYLVEINNRIGGDLIWLLVESVTGVDMLRQTIKTAMNTDFQFRYHESRGRYRIAASRALLGKFNIDTFLKTLPPGITPLKTSCWSDYPPGKTIHKASDRYGYIAVGFDSMSDFDTMFETFDDMVSRAESGR
jgi:biotin carboxylase